MVEGRHSGSVRVVGVDGYPKGWVGVVLDDSNGAGGGAVAVVAGPTVADVVQQAGSVAVAAVDIPIGLGVDRSRSCDTAAKRRLGARSSTVFLTPVRAALEASTYAEANALSRALTGAGISAQAYALRTRILEVDAWLPAAGVPVYEVHPELSFARMAGRSLLTRKTTWVGAEERRRLLAAHGIEPPAGDGVPTDVPVADVLDAAACAWTARRLVAGTAERVGPADGPAMHV
jgi:predicted RNase H-like nuclease